MFITHGGLVIMCTKLFIPLFLITIINFVNTSVLSDIFIDTLEDYETFCKGKPCIMKCCPDDLYVGMQRYCVANNDSSASLDFNDMVIYGKGVKNTTKKVREAFYLVPSALLNFTRGLAYDLSLKFNSYLIEDGSVKLELPNYYDRWTHYDRNSFCIDYALPNGETIFKPEARIWVIPVDEEYYDTDVVFVASALLVSCVFLVLTLIVYAMLPELRNLCGKILMAYVASLLCAFLMLSTLQLITLAEQHTDDICLGFTFLIYFFFLSSFCWMNVMSFDIWWTFRGYAKARPIHRRGESFKFAVYCAYASGLPFAMTVALGVLDSADLRHIPWFIKPNIIESGCFIDGGGKFVYLYVPMLAVIVTNWMFFLMTAFNIWRLSRGTAVLDSPAAGNPSAHRTHRNRFMLYLKLSIIMGTSWVLEVVSFLSPQYRAWMLSDAYNLLIGVAIFLIFVCKKKIFRKLEKSFRFQHPKWSPYSNSRSNSCSSDSDASQETTAQVCLNPSGVTQYSKRQLRLYE